MHQGPQPPWLIVQPAFFEDAANMGTFFSKARALKAQATKEWNKGYDPYPNNDKGAQVKVCCCSPVPDDSPFINTLKYDLANTVYWSGSLCKDCFFFICNWHAWVGLLMCHPNHPWKKLDRAMMQLISLAICLIPSAFIAATADHAIKELDEDPKYDGDDVAAVALKAAAKNTILAGVPLLTIVFVTIPNTIYGMIMYQVAIADTRCPHCACFWIQCKRVLWCWTLSSGIICSIIAFCIVTAIAGSDADWSLMLNPLLMSQVESAVIWFIILLPMPCGIGFWSRWHNEKKVLQAVVPTNNIEVGPAKVGK